MADPAHHEQGSEGASNNRLSKLQPLGAPFTKINTVKTVAPKLTVPPKPKRNLPPYLSEPQKVAAPVTPDIKTPPLETKRDASQTVAGAKVEAVLDDFLIDLKKAGLDLDIAQSSTGSKPAQLDEIIELTDSRAETALPPRSSQKPNLGITKSFADQPNPPTQQGFTAEDSQSNADSPQMRVEAASSLNARLFETAEGPTAAQTAAFEDLQSQQNRREAIQDASISMVDPDQDSLSNESQQRSEEKKKRLNRSISYTQNDQFEKAARQHHQAQILDAVIWFAPLGMSSAAYCGGMLAYEYMSINGLAAWIIACVVSGIAGGFAARFDKRIREGHDTVFGWLGGAAILMGTTIGALPWFDLHSFQTTPLFHVSLIMAFAASTPFLIASGVLPSLARAAFIAMWLPVFPALILAGQWPHTLSSASFLVASLVMVSDGQVRLNELVSLRAKSEQNAAELAVVASTDHLTGLINRKALFTELENRPPYNHLLIFADLDHFKAVNDRYGHATGDDVLVSAANQLRKAASANSVVARLGGDEFVVLSPMDSVADLLGAASDLELALGMSERLLKTVIAGEALVVYGVTASVGATVISPEVSLTEALSQADTALYASKDRGRNQVACYSPAMGRVSSRSTARNIKPSRGLKN